MDRIHFARRTDRIGSVLHLGRLIWALLMLPILAGAAGAATEDTSPNAKGPESSNRVVRDGIAIELRMESLDSKKKSEGLYQEGDDVTFRFSITDTTTGAPLSSVYPGAWMDLRPEGEEATPQACRKKVEAFVGGSLFAQPELDLNVYYVLALNDDATISVVDPLFGFGTTKLLDMVILKSPGEDWALTPDQTTLFVSMPTPGQVAVANTATWDVTANLDVGPSPSRIALQPDARFLWVGYDKPRTGAEQSGVSVIDVRRRVPVKHIATGKGHHELAFSDDDRYAFVTNEEDGTLSVIDIRKLEKIKDIPIGTKPVSLAFSSLGQTVYVVDQVEGAIVVVDAGRHEITARMKAEPGLGQIKFAPGGRLGFVVNPERDVVHILDASLNRIIQTADVEDGPDQIAFSDELAYVRHRDSDIILMIPLDEVGTEGRPVPVIDFTGGQAPPGRASRPSPADGIVQAPGATAVLVANPRDKAIYYYKEGMAAPMGHFQNYGREPRAVLVVDRSLEERSPGIYETTAKLRRPGLYDVVFFLDTPRVIHCFEVRVSPNPTLAAKRAKSRRVTIQPLIERGDLTVGEQARLRFKLTEPETGKPKNGLNDVRVLTFLAPGIWQKRQWAEQAGDGIYQIDFVPPRPGVYYVAVEIPSLDFGYNRSRPLILRARKTADLEKAKHTKAVTQK